MAARVIIEHAITVGVRKAATVKQTGKKQEVIQNSV